MSSGYSFTAKKYFLCALMSSQNFTSTPQALSLSKTGGSSLSGNCDSASHRMILSGFAVKLDYVLVGLPLYEQLEIPKQGKSIMNWIVDYSVFFEFSFQTRKKCLRSSALQQFLSALSIVLSR